MVGHVSYVDACHDIRAWCMCVYVCMCVTTYPPHIYLHGCAVCMECNAMQCNAIVVVCMCLRSLLSDLVVVCVCGEGRMVYVCACAAVCEFVLAVK
jgi:hypothetical protein